MVVRAHGVGVAGVRFSAPRQNEIVINKKRREKDTKCLRFFKNRRHLVSYIDQKINQGG